MLKGEERRNGHVLFLLLCIFKDNSLFRLYGSAKNYEREHDTKKLFATKEMLRRDERRIHLHTRRFIALAVGSVMLITLCVLVDEFKLSLKSGFANRKFYERLQLSSVQVLDCDHVNRLSSSTTEVSSAGSQTVTQKPAPTTFEALTRPIILVWKGAPYMMENVMKHLEFNTSSDCGSCRVTTNRSWVEKSIAVVLFNHRELVHTMDIPDQKTRRLNQTYVFWSKETPSKLHRFKWALEDKRFDSLFNVTMTMFRKSDIQVRFGTFRRAVESSKAANYGNDFKLLIKSKNKLAVWVVSSCNKLYGAVKRMEYARSLQEAGLKLDKFGKCFKAVLNKTMLMKCLSSYKFYLAFENSLHCPDYITEKFWRNSLGAGSVPIVLGPTKEDLEAVAPPNSFIFAEDFETPRKLVEYVNYLDKNDTAYLKYHKWRNTSLQNFSKEKMYQGTEDDFCRLCRRLVFEEHLPKSIPSISRWFYEGYPDDKCLQPFVRLSREQANNLTKF